ncbi:MAG: SH3 domain-containing protein [Spirochaetes bacterium]|nr:SH3 domain-containing protein [Spirochaetota bacterium]
MKKKFFILPILFIVLQLNGNANNKFGLTNDIYLSLTGVWDISKGYGEKNTFSWGKAEFVANRSIVIDLGEDEPYLLAGMMGTCKIINVLKKNNKYSIVILFRNNKKYTLDITVNNDKTIYFHEMEWFKDVKLLSFYGEKNKYFRLDGPNAQYFKSKINNLRLRNESSIKGLIIRNLDKKDKMIILKKGKKESIDGVSGNWVKVLTDKNEIGWCFDSFLEKY